MASTRLCALLRPLLSAPTVSRSARITTTTTTTSFTSPHRTYHSHDHASPPGPFGPLETRILSAAHAHIPAHGFSAAALTAGCTDAGCLAATTNLFPRGAFDLVRFHHHKQRSALAECDAVQATRELQGARPAGVAGVAAQLRELTWARLMLNAPVNSRYQEALALMAYPANVRASLAELHALSDEICYLAGDVSVDGSWYTKRASLSAIYASSELFMTQDTSRAFQETRAFMERRFDGMRELGGAVGSIGQWVGFTLGAGVNVLRSRGVRI